MRLKMIRLTICALLLAQAACRPQQPGDLAQHPPADARSRLDLPNDRELKDYQYMDQSLRTVATQLLNVSGPDDMTGVKNEGIEPKMGLLIRKPERTIPPRETVTEAVEKVEVTTTDPIRRSTNSKYSFFQASHPGQAMAMTEEELERELASTRHTSTIKPKQTTTGGLSTWILLNPPSTTSKPTEVTKKPENQKNVDTPSKSETQKYPAKNPENVKKSETQTTSPKTVQKTTEKIEENLVKITTSVKPEVSTAKPEVRITESIQKPVAVQTTTLKVTGPKKQSTTSKFEKPTTTTTTPRSEPRSTSPATLAHSTTTEETTKSSPIIKKMPPTIRTTLRPKPATSKPRTTTLRPTTVAPKATTIKAVKSGQPRPSKPPRKVTTPKPEVKSALNVTSKIEKVTFKPVHMITTPRSHIESVPKPTFSTKIQASIQTEEKSASKFAQSEVKLLEKSVPQSAQSAEKSTEKPVQKSEKPMKVHLRKPVDTPTKIEIEPIKVNPPILTIEKIGIIEEPSKSTSLKPVDSSPESTSQATTEPSTTTKKPKSKRKKHKTRRRKPSTTAAPVATSTSLKPVQPTSTSVTVPTTSVAPTKKTRKPSTTAVPDTSIQESKLSPETNSTKLKKKQTSKPLSSQIYSFLSREVMPSVGVMSLVGLGLGLASYFLYPFGGVIARRNYEVEPNYKYNPEEYGGSYGQSEEDVLKNVFQGMTPTEHPPHTSTKDFDRNYYRYQSFGDYTTRRPETKYHTASVPVYRPDNTPVPYEPKYEQKYDPKFEEKFNSKYNKNTDYKYQQDVQTTPTYFDRSKPDFTQINVDRQFVVGSIPKGYGSEDKQVQITTEAVQTDFEKQIAQNLQFVGSPGAQSFAQPDEQNFAQPDAQALRADGYEEIEITPTAVAVEHGPRSLNLDKSAKKQTEQVKAPEKSEGANNSEPTVTSDSAVKSAVEVVAALKNRRKRESVIQLIPSRAEMEKEEHEFETEEPLSNEILDIIDSALPGDGSDHKKKPEIDVKINEIEPKKEITTQKPREDLTTSGTTSSSKPKEVEVDEATKSAPTTTTTTTTTTTKDPVKSVNMEPDVETFATTPQPEESGNGIVNFLRKVAEFKFRLGLTVLKHASESFARYLGHVQKRMNGEE